MKFIVAVVIFTLAIAAQANVVPIGVWGPGWPWAAPISYTAHTAPLAVAHTLVATGPTVVAGHAPTTAIHVAPAAHVIAPAVVPVVAAEGSYVAQNRGALHIAPLPGHSQSAASINLEAAPGTL